MTIALKHCRHIKYSSFIHKVADVSLMYICEKKKKYDDRVVRKRVCISYRVEIYVTTSYRALILLLQ